jgi:hypothetical protein
VPPGVLVFDAALGWPPAYRGGVVHGGKVCNSEHLAAEMPAWRADLAKFRRDFERALVLQAIAIVNLTVALIKLLP